MVIKFVCPNGHPLSAGEEMAGKPGKCPKCQAMFLVPDAATSRAASKQPAPDDTISFLCPNGHKLSGPRALQGKAGQCPHCGSKFRVPNYDEPEETASATPTPGSESDIPVGELVEQSGNPADDDDVQDVEVVDDDDEVVEDVELDEEDLMPPPPPLENLHPLGQICARLWPSANHQVEIDFGHEQTLTATHFSPGLSQGECGVFAHRNATGDFSVTVLPWASIRRLTFPQLKELPAGMFR